MTEDENSKRKKGEFKDNFELCSLTFELFDLVLRI